MRSENRAADDGAVVDILKNMLEGDRNACAAFCVRFARSMRAKIEPALPKSWRRVQDVDDILSTVARRLDTLVRTRRLRATHPAGLWALTNTIIEHAIIDAGRRARRRRLAERQLAGLATVGRRGEATLGVSRWAHDDRDDERELMSRAFEALNAEDDRQVLAMWLNETSWTVGARRLGITPECLRKRWQKVRSRLRERLLIAGVVGGVGQRAQGARGVA